MNVRKYTPDDFNILKSWWVQAEEIPPLFTMLTPEVTFILEENNTILAAVNVLLTNCTEFAYLMGLIKNPTTEKDVIPVLLDYVEKHTKEQGYKRLMMMSYKPRIKRRYQNLGYSATLNNVTTFVKEL